MAFDGHSKACCEIPPVIAKDYSIKGTYETIGGMKTYVTGPSDATSAVLVIYDIFGYFPQTLQGADIVATTGKYKVFMPDFFDGNPCHISWYPPQTEEQKQKLGEWFPTRMPATGVAKIPGILKEIEKVNPNIKKWGVIGFCWGGKVISLTSSTNSPWSVAAQCHPAFLSIEDAAQITVPTCMLASEEEVEQAKAFEDALTVPKLVEVFPERVHGFMAARADLEDPKAKADYERGYQLVVDFFGKYL